MFLGLWFHWVWFSGFIVFIKFERCFTIIFLMFFGVSCASEARIAYMFGCFKLSQSSLILRVFKNLCLCWVSLQTLCYVLKFTTLFVCAVWCAVNPNQYISLLRRDFSVSRLPLSQLLFLWFLSRHVGHTYNGFQCPCLLIPPAVSVWGCFWLIFLRTVAHIFLLLGLW